MVKNTRTNGEYMQNELIEKIANQIDRRVSELATFSEDDAGVTRFPFTTAARGAVLYLQNYMAEVGLQVYEDSSGAVIGTLPGKSATTVVVGSHYDSVKHGGRFDGIAGVICGVELGRLLREKKIELPYTLQIVGTNDEEGVRFGDGFFSAKAFLGQWTVGDLKERYDHNGISIYEAMEKYGLQPKQIADAAWDLNRIRAFIEIHIEQGPILETHEKEIGIVTGIVGIRRYKVTIKGRADHAGTTPMNMRQDALLGAAAVIAMVPELCAHRMDTVATVGSCNVLPNTVNTVAENVVFELDMRSLEELNLVSMENQFSHILKEITEKYNVQYIIQTVLQVQPVRMDKKLQNLLTESAANRRFSSMYLHSGAGHDSLPIGRVLPTAMLFVPSEQGRSHCPEEKSSTQNLAKAVITLYDAIQKMEEE